jgi:SAM-dependent methyltransferase
MTGFAADWLAAREPADAAARAVGLLPALQSLAPPLVIRDLGCGTGAMARWLSPKLPGPQQWTLTDHDPQLLAVAAASVPGSVTDLRDFTALSADDLAGTTVVTGSAVLDLLTADEVTNLVASCVAAGAAALFTLSVVGEVRFNPADPLDASLMAAFNAHQRRVVDGRRLLGPDGADWAAEEFERLGAKVFRAPSPWLLSSGDLLDQWLAGWVHAACEWRPELTEAVVAWQRRRCTQDLRVIVDHEDLLAIP